jgi:DNA-binding beta-propeller fold protein YncE
MKILRAAAIILTFVSTQFFAQPSSGYHIVKKVLVGGEGGWDYLYVDAVARRLYVSHGDRVVVLNADSVTVTGEIQNTQGVHGIAVAPEFGRGFTSNGRSSTVTIFDLKTLKVIKEVPVNGKNPDAILYDPFSKRLFTFNGRSSDASVLDPSTGDTIAAIPMGGKPEFAVTDLKGHVYVNNEDKSQINVIDTKTMKVTAHWSLAPGEVPSGLAMDVKNHRLFSVCGNKLMVVMNADDGTIIASLPIGSGVDACAFDPDTKLAFASNGEGTMTVIRQESPDKYSVIDNVVTQRGARTMALDLKTHALFTPSAEYGATPPATAERPRPRPAIVPNSFVILRLQR